MGIEDEDGGPALSLEDVEMRIDTIVSVVTVLSPDFRDSATLRPNYLRFARHPRHLPSHRGTSITALLSVIQPYLNAYCERCRRQSCGVAPWYSVDPHESFYSIVSKAYLTQRLREH